MAVALLSAELPNDAKLFFHPSNYARTEKWNRHNWMISNTRGLFESETGCLLQSVQKESNAKHFDDGAKASIESIDISAYTDNKNPLKDSCCGLIVHQAHLSQLHQRIFAIPRFSN